MQQLKLVDSLTIYSFLALPEDERKALIKTHGSYLNMDYADILTVQNNLPLFRAFIMRADEVMLAGFKKYGGRAIMEHLRWNTSAHDNSRLYKITNDITPRFCELSMSLFPQLNGFFNTHGGRS